jgi:GTP-binding protein
VKVVSAEFVKSVAGLSQLPKEHYSHIAFVGRSNVGKSSLINSLLQRKKLAQISSTPGKTALLNFFLLNGVLYFVDFPGYGYAKRSKEERDRWGKLIEEYLQTETRLKAVILLIDIRHGLSEDDRDFLAWLHLHRRAVIVVFTKADKLASGARKIKMQEYATELKNMGLGQLIAYSVMKGWGKDDLWKAIAASLA